MIAEATNKHCIEELFHQRMLAERESVLGAAPSSLESHYKIIEEALALPKIKIAPIHPHTSCLLPHPKVVSIRNARHLACQI